jgi:serine/threonine protein kinase
MRELGRALARWLVDRGVADDVAGEPLATTWLADQPRPAPQPDLAQGRARTSSIIDGKYRVERVIAEGGIGVIVLATQIQLDRQVAIKLLRPDAVDSPGVVECFEREARLAAQIRSEHVVRIHDVGSLGRAAMVMEYLDGIDLGARPRSACSRSTRRSRCLSMRGASRTGSASSIATSSRTTCSREAPGHPASSRSLRHSR